jgi:alpha-N-acetylglucosaminidase
MRRTSVALACFALVSLALRATACAAEEDRVDLKAVRRLAERVLGDQATNFVFEAVPASQGKDVFELESRDGTVVVRGNSALSMSVGLNWYLKYHAQASVSLNGCQVALPKPMPALPEKFRQTAWAKSRYFLNYCTFGYSMPWWDWTQWEFFIDWMALNGINQPLAVTGQEAVWQAVGRRFGMTEDEIGTFLAGPPYLPFGWMGCLDGHGGPLPKEWIPQHVELQKKILARERELGMTPVLQGFTGHTPDALLKKFPDTKAQRIHWIEFDTWMLDPTDPLFQKIGAAFVEEQTRLFGTDHLYDADSFIEMTPPSGDLAYLANTGRAIFEGMAKADPQAVWLLQGWTFMNQGRFWTQDRIKAFLDAVPSEHMLVLDLFCESNPVWNKTQGFYGKPWTWSFVYNFGNRTLLGSSGPLARFNDLADVRRDRLGRNVRGVGLMMEGYSHNPPIFDLMYELAWRDDVDLAAWVRDFARYRYGSPNANAQAAWEILRASLYSQGRDGQTIVTAFPALGRGYARYPAGALAGAWRLLSRSEKELGGTDTYRHDVVNVARQALAQHAGQLYERAMEACRAKDAAACRQASGEFLQLIRDLDELVGTREEFLLGSWLEDAKRWGGTDEERARLEWNARRVLTLWGMGASLRDYAWKEWSGMLTGFYGKRWEIFFRRLQDSLDTGTPFDQGACQAELYEFENEWCNRTESYPSKPRGDSLAVARRLFEKYMAGVAAAENLATGKPVTCSFALPGMEAEFANDGVIDTENYWGTDVTKDNAAWWRVDLEKETVVGRVVVVGYYGDQRHYGFAVEGSLDGKTWAMLADRRDNVAPSTRDGYECAFTPREVRYLRVTQTANSANTGRHLVEVLAYEK